MPPDGWVNTSWWGFILQSLGCSVVILLALVVVGLLIHGLEKWSSRPARKERLWRKADRLYKKSERM